MDDRRPGDDENLILYPPYLREDRETKEVVVHMTRLFAFPDRWAGDAMIYRLKV